MAHHPYAAFFILYRTWVDDYSCSNDHRLGRHITKRRKAMGLTQGKIAERLEVEPITISRCETGAALPSLASLPLLAQTFVRAGTPMSAQNGG
mgnify:CR=1 FL=1